MNNFRKLAAIFAFVLLAASCGQKAGVHEEAIARGEIPSDLTGQNPDGIVDPDDPTDPDSDNPTDPQGPGSNDGGPAEVPPPGEGDTTGITSTTIKIGIHAPLTGAAPISPTSFREGKDLYWKGKKVLGRNVVTVFEDDHYNPSHAKQVCQKMVEQDKVFLLIGGGGTDQVQSCARYAASVGVPYLSAGVTEIGIRGLQNYFALSMSYAQQGPLLAQYIKREFTTDAARVAMVATDTPNFDDAVDSFTEAFPGVKVFRPAKNERGSSMAGNLCTGNVKNYDVVYPLVAPTYYLEMAGAAKCNPQYAGVGVTQGLDTVASTGCRAGNSTANAIFFSPAPAFFDSNDYDPEFRKAGGTDDIMFLLWGVAKSLHILFENVGPGISRESFIAETETTSVRTGVYPDLEYSPEERFGAKQVHVLKCVCTGDSGHHETIEAFKSSF
jgi:branched-chain amino acid transport system substrate-binding protein